MSCRRQSRTRIPFVTTTYTADTDGVVRPELPSYCVYATGAQTCCIFVDHYRFRKTGPRFSLAVIGCTVHPYGRYTLYPPGYFPYSRVPMAPYSTSGTLMRETSTGKPLWEQTLFAAAMDASEGERWPEESPWDDPRRRRTQGRRLQQASRLVGVDAEFGDRDRERIASCLAVATMKLIGDVRSDVRSEANAWSPSWQQRGAAIVGVLQSIPIQASLLDRMLAAGAVGGLWARRDPQRWEAARGTWIVLPAPVSDLSEHPAAATLTNRGPPPTNTPDAR